MTANDLTPEFAIDIVFCVDCTFSMRPYLTSVKATASSFDTMLAAAMAEKDKRTSQVRVRVIAYRDLDYDGQEWLEESPFFVVPEQLGEFQSFVDSLQWKGGGDEPESGLEAVALAIGSDWERTLDRRRHVIVVCTDASAHPLGTHPAPPNSGIPGNLDELRALWGDAVDDGMMDFKAKRLVLFAPDADPWNSISETWENVIWFPAKAGRGMGEAEQREVLDQIAGSV